MFPNWSRPLPSIRHSSTFSAVPDHYAFTFLPDPSVTASRRLLSSARLGSRSSRLPGELRRPVTSTVWVRPSAGLACPFLHRSRGERSFQLEERTRLARKRRRRCQRADSHRYAAPLTEWWASRCMTYQPWFQIVGRRLEIVVFLAPATRFGRRRGRRR